MSKWIKRGFILISILVMFQTVMILLLGNKIKQLYNVQDANYSDVIYNINNIDTVIQSTLNNELSKTHLIKETHFTIDKTTDKGCILNVRTELSRLEEGSNVMFLFKEDSSSEWLEIEMEEIGSLSYTCNIDVKFDKEYSYKVATVGNLSESSDILPINKDEYMPIPPGVTGYGNDKENLSITLTKDLYNDKDKEYKIKKIEAIVKSSGKEKTYSFKEGTKQEYEENGTIINNISYEVTIPTKDYKNGLEYIKVKVTYDNGITDIREITHEIDSYFLE